MPYVVYVWLWVGLALLSMVFGPIWRVLNPIRWLHRGILAAARVSADFSLARYRAGYWPAALGLFAFTWLELIAPDNDTLPVLRVAVLGFILISLVLALVFGRDYVDTGDPFEAWSGLFGTSARWGAARTAAGSCAPPARAQPARLETGAARHRFRHARRHGLRRLLRRDLVVHLRAVLRTAGRLWETAALLTICLVVAGSLYAAAALSASLAHVPLRGVATRFAPSLLPIAAGYLVAHYWSLWVFEGVNGLARLSDPLGTGANWLGTAGVKPSYALIEPTLVATIQMVSIVTGHLLGVVLAHERAVTLFPRRVAVIGQIPLLVLMVFYTVGGLTLLFSH